MEPVQSFKIVALLLLGEKVLVGEDDEDDDDCVDFNSYLSHR